MIIEHPNPILSEKCQAVRVHDWSDKNLHFDVNTMIEALESSDGVGLAAPQVGLNKRIILLKRSSDSFPTVMINPHLIKTSKKFDSSIEECLSLPGRRFIVCRFKQIWYGYTSLVGDHKISSADGFTARIIQHEIDHLDGITIADRGREIIA